MTERFQKFEGDGPIRYSSKTDKLSTCAKCPLRYLPGYTHHSDDERQNCGSPIINECNQDLAAAMDNRPNFNRALDHRDLANTNKKK